MEWCRACRIFRGEPDKSGLLNLFDYHEYEEFGQFHSELQFVFEFLRYSGERDLMEKKLQEHREQYEELSSQAKVLLARLTNMKKIPGIAEKEFEI